MAEWISVKDRLPEENVPVLICTQEGAIWMAEYLEERRPHTTATAYWETVDVMYGCGAELETTEVTHWMPLPEPPGGEENEN